MLAAYLLWARSLPSEHAPSSISDMRFHAPELHLASDFGILLSIQEEQQEEHQQQSGY
jgi:hypothetical protein